MIFLVLVTKLIYAILINQFILIDLVIHMNFDNVLNLAILMIFINVMILVIPIKLATIMNLVNRINLVKLIIVINICVPMFALYFDKLCLFSWIWVVHSLNFKCLNLYILSN